ncbi:MAG: universal stress protein [Bacteroidetes bacterium]|nr:universal stress protein [Bacteroidota bacterium]MBS1976790.1 universal stress protein [Bacteroidota bacterium]
MKKILVPTDFSPCAEYAAETAIDIAERANAEVLFLHLQPETPEPVHVPHTGGWSPHNVHDQNMEMGSARHALDQWVAKATHRGVEASSALAVSKGGEWIEDYLSPYKVDMVVMGSCGASGIKEIFLGSNAQHVARHSNVPVLVVKKKTETLPFRNIVFVSDFTTDLIKPMERIIDLVTMTKANLHMLYVNTPYHFRETHEIESQMKRFTHQIKGITPIAHIYNGYNEESGIRQFVKDHNIDLIALTTHGTTGFLRMLKHSIAEELVNHEDVPVMVINIKSLQ